MAAKNAAATLHFTELLLALLRGKTGLTDALYILSQEGIERPVRESANSLLAMMKKGKGLSESLRVMREGKVFFPPLYLALIDASELTGNIETVLERVVIDMRRKQRAKENIVSILIYPAIIVLIAVAGTAMIISIGIPFFASGGLVSADIISEAVTGVSIAGAVLLLGGGGLFWGYFRIFNNDSPEFRIFYMLDFLLGSNVTLLESLSHCIVSMEHTKYGKALVTVKKNIASGISFSEAFVRTQCFPPYVLGWLAVADRHGSIGDACGNIRDYYAQRDGRTREIAAKLIEPAVIALTGLYVLIIMVTVILPILTYAGGTL